MTTRGTQPHISIVGVTMLERTVTQKTTSHSWELDDMHASLWAKDWPMV